MEQAALFPAYIVLGILLLLNVLVAVLYFIEYRKNKRQTLENREALATFKQMFETLMPSLNGIEDQHEAKLKAQAALDESIAQSHKLVADATMQAQAIMLQASTEAQAVIAGAKGSSEDVTRKLNEALDKTIQEQKAQTVEAHRQFEQQLRDQLMQVVQQEIITLKNLEKATEEAANAQILAFMNELKTTLTEFGTKERDVMQKELLKVQQALEDYKKEEMTKIEAYIYEILARTSESVLGQAVNLDMHQELIIKALEQAKREGMFA